MKLIEIPRVLFEDFHDPKVVESMRPPKADETFEKKIVSPVKKYPPLWLEYCETLCADLVAVHASERDARLENGIPVFIFALLGGYAPSVFKVLGKGFWMKQRLVGVFPKGAIGQYEKFVYGFHEYALRLTQRADRKGHWQIEETGAWQKCLRRMRLN